MQENNRKYHKKKILNGKETAIYIKNDKLTNNQRGKSRMCFTDLSIQGHREWKLITPLKMSFKIEERRMSIAATKRNIYLYVRTVNITLISRKQTNWDKLELKLL